MDTPAFSKPRLKLGRSSPGLRSEENTPIAGPSRFRFPRDDDGNNSSSQEATPKLSATASLPPESGSGLYADLDPSARLRALIARNNATPRKSPPPRFASSETDSELEAPTFASDARSVAQESLRELFANATRSPGDTPQRTWRRRNSIDASEVEAVPRVSHARSKHKPKRHSKSDDETDKSMHEVSESEREVVPRPAATFDLLRERLAKSTADFFDGDSFLQELRELKSSRDLAVTSTPFRTMQMPSHLQSQSNLLDQDSDMNNALDGLNSSYASSAKQAQVPFPPPSLPIAPDEADTTPPSQPINGAKSQTRETGNDRPQSPLQRERSRNRPRHSMPNYPSHNPGNSDSAVGGSPANGYLRNPPSSGNDGFLGANHSLSRRNSSVSSYAEHRERMSELEKERNREREREWNKRHPTPSHKLTRPSSSLSLRSYHQNDMTDPTPRTRTQSQVSPFGIAKRTPPGRDTSLGRRHSSYGSPQIPPSPSTSIDSLDSWKERQQEMEEELQHERERNWGSPHPKWPSRERRTSITSTSASASASPSPSPSPGRGSYTRIRAGSLNQPQTLRSKASISSLAPSPSPTPQSKSPSSRPLASFARPTKSSMSHAARPLSQAGSPATTRTTKTSFSRARASPHGGSNSSGTSGSGSQIGKYVQSPPVSPSPSPGREVKAEPERSVTPGVSSRFGWPFPTRSHTPVFSEDGSPQHSRKLSSPLPESRYSRLDHAGKISHIPVRASPSPSRPGHKRATTELNDAFGRVPPPKITVDDLPRANGNGKVPMLDSNLMHVEEDSSAAMETTPVVQPAPLPVVDEVQTDEAQTPEDSLQLQEEEEEQVDEQVEEQLDEQEQEQEEEEEEAENATPVPDENEIEEIPSPPASPLPPSPTKEEAASALPSPPPESPMRSHTQSLLSLETPPRNAASNASRVEFLSPSPPRGGLPELPALPSFSEEEEIEQEEVTPQRIDESALPIKTPKPPGSWDVSIRQPMKELDDNSPENHRANFTIMNTPKPPGAWAVTPAPAPKQPPLPHSQTDDSSVSNTENTGLLTPLPTLTRASTMPAITPGTARRKSILKVRFDVNQATDTSSEVDTPRPAEPQPKDEVVQKELDFWTDALHAQKDLNGDEVPLPARPETPEPVASSRKQRRPQTPGIRVLDSFGREKTEDEKTPKDPSSQSTQQQSPRNRSGVRLVDAMGHAVQEEDSSFNSTVSTVKSEDDTTTTETEADTPLSQSEALAKLRRRLASLSEGLRDADRSVNELDANDHRTEELQEMSRHAREERARIARRLEEINLRDWKSGALSSENNPLLQSTKPVRRLKSWMPWILSFLLVQVGIVLFAYHFSSSQARDLFLRTYFDPFHPYLHLYTVQPPPDEASITLSSILSGEGRLSDLATVIRVWQNRAWEAWNDMGSERRITWPAT